MGVRVLARGYVTLGVYTVHPQNEVQQCYSDFACFSML